MAQRDRTGLHRGLLADGTFGAWVLTCDPTRYDLGPEFERGSVDGWWPAGPADGAHVPLMRRDQPVLLWMSGTSGEFPPGFWAVGRLDGRVATAGRGRLDPVAAGWHDDGPHVPVELDILDPPVPAADVDDDVVLGSLEVLHDPDVAVSWLTAAQLAALADFAVVPPGGPGPSGPGPHGRGLALAG